MKEKESVSHFSTKIDHCANCPIHSKDKIGTLAQNVNDLYSNLLSTIEHLEREKDAVRDMERAKVEVTNCSCLMLTTTSSWVLNASCICGASR